MNKAGGSILIAEDDLDDRLMTQDAFALMTVQSDVEFVQDGQSLLDYLDDAAMTLPSLILLDLNMPRMTGKEAITALKASSRLKHIPVVIFTTSRAEDDVLASYRLGASSYVTKPRTFDGLVAVVAALQEYWLRVVRLPHEQ